MLVVPLLLAALLLQGRPPAPPQRAREARRRDRRSRAGLLLLLLPGLACGTGADGPPDLLLISIDTLRADRLGAYGYAPGSTPALDRLAAEGILFEQAVSPAPLTLPSHVTMLTGLIPARHGVRSNKGFTLPAEAVTLPEALGAHGYQTAAFVAGLPLERSSGLDQGFDRYDDRMTGGPVNRGLGTRTNQRYAEEVLPAALEWLAAADRDRPVFAFVHLFDPHAPYERPLPGESDGSYDGEVAHVDAEIGRFLASLEGIGRPRRRITLITSDHGEGLGEHGESTHAMFVYESTQRVPLILHGLPGEPPARVSAPVGLVDVAPTLLELAGLPAWEDVDGVSLLDPQEAGRPFHVETLYPQLRFGWAPLRGVRRGPLKFIQAPHPELYDLGSDPAERQNLYGRQPERAADLAELVRAVEAAEARLAPGGIDERQRAALESLGYLSAPPSRAPAGGAPADPKDRIAVYEEFQAAVKATHEGEVERALRMLAGLEESLQASAAYWERRGDLAIRAGERSLGIRCYRRYLDLEPGNGRVRINLGLALSFEGQGEAALREFEEVLRREPDRAEAHLWAGLVLAEQLKDPAGARRHLQEFLRLAPDHRRADLARRTLAGLPASATGADR